MAGLSFGERTRSSFSWSWSSNGSKGIMLRWLLDIPPLWCLPGKSQFASTFKFSYWSDFSLKFIFGFSIFAVELLMFNLHAWLRSKLRLCMQQRDRAAHSMWLPLGAAVSLMDGPPNIQCVTSCCLTYTSLAKSTLSTLNLGQYKIWVWLQALALIRTF